jgi:hypothetical protein
VSNCGLNNFDSTISVFADASCATACVRSDDDGCGPLGSSSVTFAASQATYYAVIMRYGGGTTTSTYNLALSSSACELDQRVSTFIL